MEKSAGIVLFRREGSENLFLLLHYPSGHWDFVKGHKETGETDRQTAIRESKEETGITDMEFIDGFEKRIRYSFRYCGRTIRKQVVFFLAQTDTQDVCISEEHQDFLWTNYQESMRQVTFDNARRVLYSANRFLAKVGLASR